MRQHSIDLLPDSVRLRCLARVRTGQTVAAFIAVIITLVLVISYGRFEVTQGQRELERTRQQANIVLDMERRAAQLGESFDESNQYLELYRNVAPPVEVSAVLATIINDLPESVSLDRIDLDAGTRVRIRTARSRGSQRDSKDDAPAPRVLNCEIAGFALSDEQVAEIVDRLRSQRPFERVSLDFSRTRLVREKPAREFRLSCRVDLERLYDVTAAESAVAAADESTQGSAELMWDTKHIIATIVAPVTLLAIGTAAVVWPTYKEAAALRTKTASLQRKVESLDRVNATVEDLGHRLGELQSQMNADLKVIPDDAEVALLMRRLSLPVDGQTVLDQTFTTGTATPAIQGETDATVAAMPLTVDMESNFDSVFALIKAAESMQRLVRVTSVRIQCDRKDARTDIDGSPLLTASVGLEAIYRIDPQQEGP